jgi:hypothetical protein
LFKVRRDALQWNMAAPQYLAYHAPRPIIECLSSPKDGVADLIAATGRFNVLAFDTAPESNATAESCGLSLKFFVCPLGVNGVDPNLDEVLQGIATRAVATEKNEFVVLMQYIAVFAEQRLEKRSPDLHSPWRGRNPPYIVAKRDAVDMRSRPRLNFRAKENVQLVKHGAKVPRVATELIDGHRRTPNLPQEVQGPDFTVGQRKAPRTFTDRVYALDAGRIK